MDIKTQFEIGDWVSDTVDIGQILYIRNHYVEQYCDEYFEGLKVGSYYKTYFILKILCEYDGKIKKRNRISSYESDFFRHNNEKEQKIVNKIKKTDEYNKYILYDQKFDDAQFLYIDFVVEEKDISKIKIQLDEIKGELKASFTFKEFLKVSKEKNFLLDFKKSYRSDPNVFTNFQLIFKNPLAKFVNKERIYSSVLGTKI